MSLRQLNPFGSTDGDGSGKEATHPLPAVDVSTHDAMTALKNARRRYVLDYLERTADRVTLAEIADARAAVEHGEHFDSDERKGVYVGLYQTHLPQPDNIGVIRFDKDRGIVEATDLTAPFTEFARVIERATVGDNCIEGRDDE